MAKEYKKKIAERMQHANTDKEYAEDLTQKEIDKIVHDKKLQESESPLDKRGKDGKLRSNEDLTRAWEENMKDFVPEDFISFEINEG